MVQVSSNSSINNFLGGLLNNVVGGAVNVALSPVLSKQWLNTLGFSSLAPENLLGAIVTPGLLDLGNQAITQTLTNSLLNSGAFGPGSSLVQGIISPAIGNLSQGLLGSLLPNYQSNPNKYFPGAGDEPDADYGGSVYNLGQNGPDVVFSIKPAVMGSKSEVVNQINGNGPGGVPPTVSSNLSLPSSSGKLGTPKSDYSKSFQTAATNRLNVEYSADAATFTDPGSPLGSPNLFKSFSKIPLDLAFSSNLELPISSGNTQTEGVAWNFICAPEEISWETSAQVDRIQIFGTNFAPVISGSRGMRELSISNALVEGFSRGKSVEKKVTDLEKLLNFSLDTSRSYVKVPVYWIQANDKKYGDIDGGCFVIKDIKVKEEMRDLTGLTTRATVDISFTQVPSYQVDDGRDIASKTVSGATSDLAEPGRKVSAAMAAQANQRVDPKNPSSPPVPSGAKTGSAGKGAGRGDSKK